MLGLMFGDREMYRLATVRLDRDAGNPLGLDETLIPGGPYLRLRLRGEVPAVYDSIGQAFEHLMQYADHDPDRPLIEYYIHEGRIDCLVPIKA
jgi:DNA gyrase inhibitor GyrI